MTASNIVRSDVGTSSALLIRNRGVCFLAVAVLLAGPCFSRGAGAADERPRATSAEAARAGVAESGFPQGPLAMGYLDLMERYLDLMQKFTRLAEDPAAAGIAGVFGSKDLFGSEDPARAIEFFTGILPEVKNEAVQRAIRIQLIDLYKKSGQRDKALEQLRVLVTSAPAETREVRELRESRESREPREPRDRRDGRPAVETPVPPATR